LDSQKNYFQQILKREKTALFIPNAINENLLREAIFKNNAGPKIDPFKFSFSRKSLFFFILNLRQKKKRKNEFHQIWTMFWSPPSTTQSNIRVFCEGGKNSLIKVVKRVGNAFDMHFNAVLPVKKRLKNEYI
jgi:hypothetical protein